MPESSSLIGFVLAALIVLIIPGPGVLYVVARSVTQGQRAGLVSALGLSLGVLFHTSAAALGLSAILLASATAFSLIKLLGACYLIYLGIRAFVGGDSGQGWDTSTRRPLRRLFTDGIVVTVLNPKAAVFFLAFLPQFADPSRGGIPQQVMILGLIYMLLAVVTDSSYALLAGQLRGLLGHQLLAGPWPRRVSGGVYVGLGLGMAISERQ